jgi:hypothetical protein
MSDVVRRLPARPSLEQLHKQAKELLRKYRAGQESMTLADAQFALAREYGFESWAKLKHHVEAMRSAAIFHSAKPPFYKIDWRGNSLSASGQLSEKDWETVFAAVKEHKITRLSADGMTNAALPRLAKLDQVTHLNVAASQELTDEGLQPLAAMPQLQDLELGGARSPITDHGLDVLQQLRELRRFQSCWTKGISDTGLANLAFCHQLEDVNLLGTRAGDGLIQALAGKRHLRRFKSGYAVTDGGLKLLHEFPMLKTWHGGEIKYGLMSAETEPNHLLIDGPFSNAGVASLVGLNGLFALTFFWHCPQFTSAGLAPLRQLPNFGFLGCQNQHCDDEAMRHISAMPGLRMLMGQGAIASDKGFAALSRSQTIEYIWGRECPNLTGRGFAALKAMPALRGIALSSKNVDDAALSELPHFPALRELLPMDVSDAGFRHVGACESLESLWCMYCQETGDAATGHIANLAKLKSYYAGKTKITDRSLKILGRLTSLERLEFWQCAEITNAGVAHLANLPHLREVVMSGLANVTRDAVALFPAPVRVNYS